MLFDLALISVILSTGYLGPQVLRQLGPGQRVYGWMLLGNLLLAVLALIARRSDDQAAMTQAVGALAIFAAVLLVFIPPLLRDVARRALGRNRPRFARFITEIREHLQPGMGAREECEFIDIIIATQNGREDEAVKALQGARASAKNPLEVRRFDERVVLTYLYARRWQDAVKHFEATLQRLDGPTSTQLLVEMVRAYCEIRMLSKAASLLQVLESSALADELMFSALINRARLMFLAFAGRTAAVEGMIGRGGPLESMPKAARRYWAGMARLNAGDRQGAQQHLQEAMTLADRDPRARDHAALVLGTLDEAGVLGPHVLSPEVAELCDTVSERASQTPRSTGRKAVALRGVGFATVPVTASLIALNLLSALAMYIAFRSSSDIGALILAGANVKTATLSGEWYRLVSSIFLHAGWVHLALNMYGLWTLGKLVEQFVGSQRFLVIYLFAGLGGALASLYFGGPATSVGASGAVFGVLGAGIVELWLGKDVYPRAFRRSLLGNFLFFAAASVIIGFSYPQIDLAAHVGGFVMGGVLLVFCKPRGSERARRLGDQLVLLLACAGALLVGYGIYGVVRSDFSETLAASARVPRLVGGIALQAPETWQAEGPNTLAEPGLVTAFELMQIEDDAPLDKVVAAATSAEQYGGARKIGFDRAEPVRTRLFHVPAPWQADELLVTIDASGGHHRFRAVIFARKGPGKTVWLGSLYTPELLSPYLDGMLGQVLQSASAGSP